MKTNFDDKSNDEVTDHQIRLDLTKTYLEIQKMQKDIMWYGINVWLPSIVVVAVALIAVVKWG